MKVVQVHTFYTGYLADYRLAHPDVLTLPYADQLDALLADGFSACHLFVRHLDPQRFERRLIVGNDEMTQRQWAKESGLPEDLPLHEIVRAQIEAWQPDILYLSDPVTYDSAFVNALNWRPRLILGWRAASIHPHTDWQEFDAILSNHQPTLDEALRRGARSAIPFQPGFPRFLADAVSEEPERHDVLFCGSWSSEHATRNKVWTDLAQACAVSIPPVDLRYHLMAAQSDQLPFMVAQRNRGPLFGIAMHRALKSGRICMNAMIDLGRGMSANMRLFEIAGTGSFQLMEHHADIRNFFEPDKEIVTYKDTGEMMEKIGHYLAHPVERMEIARRGQERCLNDYSMARRANEFAELIERLVKQVPSDRAFGMIGAKQQVQRTPPNPTKQELRNLRKELKAYEKRNAKLEQRLSTIDRSLSWKITKPLFKFESWLRGRGEQSS